jgi:hypothetical protein
LGLSDVEIERLSAEQLLALAERHREQDRRADYRAALVASVLANVNRDPKRRSEPYTPFDFMPDPWPRPCRGGPTAAAQQRVKLSPEQMLERVRAINAALGGEDKTAADGIQ